MEEQTSAFDRPAQSPRTTLSIRRWRETDAGQTLVEFSLILPIMLLLLFALVDFGRGFYTWLVLTNAAREGARVGAVQQPLAVITTKVKDTASGLTTTSPTLTITVTNPQGARGQSVTVDLSYNFQFVTPMGAIVNLLSGGNLTAPTITSHASMRLE
jgi:Flp pilus assembly protein TadG